MVKKNRVFLYAQPRNQTLKPNSIELGLHITSLTAKMVRRKSIRIDDWGKEPINDDDRITRLPNDVIHHIYSFIDSRFLVQSSLLSHRWRNTWKSHPHLRFETAPFTHQKFPSFVHRFLSDRENNAEISTIDFRSTSMKLSLLKEVITYGMSHRTQKLNIEYSSPIPTRRGGFDLSLIRSHFLQDLYLNIDVEFFKTPNLTWDLPFLTTLHLERVTFKLYLSTDDGNNTNSLELFSTFSNLKNLVLLNCRLWDIDAFYIISSGLKNLTLNCLHHSCQFVISAPKLSSFTYDHMDPSFLSANDLNSLETVIFRTISDGSMRNQPEYVELMINAFHQLYKAKFITLNTNALIHLWRFLILLEISGCPFVRLQTLTLDEMPLYVVISGIIRYFRSFLQCRAVIIDFNSASSSNRDMGCNEQITIRFT